MLIGLGTTLVHRRNEPRTRLARSLPVVVGKVYEHNIGKALNSAANLRQGRAIPTVGQFRQNGIQLVALCTRRSIVNFL